MRHENCHPGFLRPPPEGSLASGPTTRSCIRAPLRSWRFTIPSRISFFNSPLDPEGEDLLSNNQFASMATPNQGRAHETMGSPSFMPLSATSPFLPSTSPVGGHAQGEWNMHSQHHSSSPVLVFDRQRQHDLRTLENTSPSLLLRGSLHQSGRTASNDSPVYYPGPFSHTQHGSFHTPFHTPTRQGRALSSSQFQVDEAFAMPGLSSFPVDPTIRRMSGMQYPVHGNIENSRREKEAFLHTLTGNANVGMRHPYGHEQDYWQSATIGTDNGNPAHMGGTAHPAAFCSLNTGNPSGEWHGTPGVTTRTDVSDPFSNDDRSLLPRFEHYPPMDLGRPQVQRRQSVASSGLYEKNGRCHPPTSVHNFSHFRTEQPSDVSTHTVDGNPGRVGRDSYVPAYPAYQYTVRQPPSMTSSFFTGPTLDIPHGNGDQHEAYGVTAAATYHPQWGVPDITITQAQASRADVVNDPHAVGRANLGPGNTNRRRSATSSQPSTRGRPRSERKSRATSAQPSTKGRPRKGRTLNPLSPYKKEERSYKRKTGVCASCRLKKTFVSS